MYIKLTPFEKFTLLMTAIIKEFLIGTSIYLNSLFLLKINGLNSTTNALFWIVLFNFIFDGIVVPKTTTNLITIKYFNLYMKIVRVVFIFVNIAAFGFNIFR